MTLVEIIVTIAIMGIIMSICMPKNRIRDYKLHSQARILLNDIRTIKHRSMTEGGTHTVYLDRNSYLVTSNTNNLDYNKEVELGGEIELEDNLEKKISFNFNGCPIKSGTINLQDKVNMKYYEITIVPYTGRVLLKQQKTAN